jgi:hypothetical protein
MEFNLKEQVRAVKQKIKFLFTYGMATDQHKKMQLEHNELNGLFRTSVCLAKAYQIG